MVPKIKWNQTERQALAFNLLWSSEITDLLFGGGAGGGKTDFGCGCIILASLKYEGSRWVIARETLKRLKETTLVTFFIVAKRWGLVNGVHFKYNKLDNIITFWNGSEVLLKELKYKPSDPNFDDLGSLEITGGFIDEANQIVFKAYEVLRSRCRFRLDDYGIKPKMLMSCNPAKNWVKGEFFKPWKDGKLPEYRAFVQALVHDNPFITKTYVENLQRIRDVNIRARLLDGDWDFEDDPSAWFDYDTIMDLFTNKAAPSNDRYVTGDVSRKGRDMFPLGYWEGLQLKKVYVIPDDVRRDHVKAAKWIETNVLQPHMVRRSQCILDEDGVGGGIVDILGCKGFLNGSSPLPNPARKQNANDKDKKAGQNFLNLKSQCYWELSELALEGKVGIELEDDTLKELLIEELQQIKQKDIDKDGAVACTPKEKIKENLGRSPDLADMVMMRMYFELKPASSIKSFIVT